MVIHRYVYVYPVGLCFGSQRGDESLLRPLLRQGLDPNPSDDGGRTLLVNWDGNVPVWEAMVASYLHVAEFLLENGADLRLRDIGQFACLTA
ncbi:hypothetical protein MLD38_014387 [Melastoma candidum]|uniref:Uncharacterized protein n=1 Tax=Melastoma candidum TaxID=119954 RepID=A0ACB9RCQ0_9MYRT|nr:hypothetical protein MLD38_014387 [Melastoma candidum]